METTALVAQLFPSDDLYFRIRINRSNRTIRFDDGVLNVICNILYSLIAQSVAFLGGWLLCTRRYTAFKMNMKGFANILITRRNS